jgi:hypothetical protein
MQKRRVVRLMWVLGVLGFGLGGGILGCDPVETKNVAWDAGTNGNTNTNWNNNTNLPDASIQGVVKFTGVTWSPGADLSSTLEVNRFPIPGALVAAYTGPPQDLPQEMYCNECVEIDDNVPHEISDAVDGSFELTLLPGRTYYLTVQKGEFRRVRQIEIPDTPGEEFTLEPSAPDVPRPPETTLPNKTDLAAGDNIPKIAIIDGAYEDQSIMFEALGFDYEGEFDVYDYDTVDDLLGSLQNLEQYNLIVIPCGESWPGGANAVENLKEYVKRGGKLYIDDFNYDFAEQVWPEFLVFYVRDDPFGMNPGGVCGDGDDTSPNTCNDWAGDWNFIGTPGDEDFENWIKLPNVNDNNPIELLAAWDSIYELNAGEVGIDEENGTGPNGEIYMLPKVWMYGDDTPAGANKPTTVSWPYYCGKVLYTVYHTHSGSAEENYELLLQEKIMMYLIMEIQTCSTGPVVE